VTNASSEVFEVNANDSSPIPTPLPLVLQRVRYQLVPVATLVLSCVLAGWLWVRRGGAAVSVGEVNAVRVNINAKADGMLTDPGGNFPAMFDQVKAGAPVARLDSSHIEAQIARYQDEVDKLKTELETITKQGASKKGPTTAPAATGADGAVAGNAADADETVVASAGALRISIGSKEAKIQELTQQLQNLEIKAPISGRVVEIHRRPGQAVQLGNSIITIASDKGEYIVSYVRQTQPITPREDMPVDVRPRSSMSTHRTRVIAVGPQVEAIPPHQLRDPKVPEFGLPVHVALPAGVTLKPGELVDLFFHPSESAVAKAGG
jgi:multidrug resistance efflux pump